MIKVSFTVRRTFDIACFLEAPYGINMKLNQLMQQESINISYTYMHLHRIADRFSPCICILLYIIKPADGIKEATLH